MKRKQITAVITAMSMIMGMTIYGTGSVAAAQVDNEERTEIESTLNLANNKKR